jgi:voltage-gated potassium channel
MQVVEFSTKNLTNDLGRHNLLSIRERRGETRHELSNAASFWDNEIHEYPAADFQTMIQQVLFALAFASVTVFLHAVGTVRVVFPAIGMRQNIAEAQHLRRPVWTLTLLVGLLLVLHVFEMAIWAAAYAAKGIFSDFETSLYYSVKSYTTVGYGDVLPPNSWRLLGPLEAAVGILMLGWSTGIIVAAVQRLYNTRLEPPQSDR